MRPSQKTYTKFATGNRKNPLARLRLRIVILKRVFE
jgi:hypothetical protein